jgi:nitroreductase
LFAQVLRRHTPKVDFDPAQPVTAQTLDQLLARAGSAGVRAGGSVDAARVQPLRELCLAAAKIELSTGRTALESQRLTRVGPDEILRHRDGISINTPAARIATSLGLFDRSVAPAAGSMAMEQMVGRYVGHTASAMGFAWLATPGNSRSSQLEAGRAYVRLQLKATGLGVGMHPMSQALQEFGEMAGPYRKVHQLLAQQGETVQMLCRLGYPAAPVEPAPRRPVASLFYGS